MKKHILMLVYALGIGAHSLSAQTIVAYENNIKTTYEISNLTSGCLVNSDSIIISGNWTNADLKKLNDANKKWATISPIKKFDMSAATFSDNITSGFVDFFSNKQKLESIVMPTSPVTVAVNLEGTFSFLYTGPSVLDLSMFKNVTNYTSTFNGSTAFKTIILPSEINNKPISLSSTFSCNYLENIINLDKLTNVISWEETFYNTYSLKEIHIGSDVYNLSGNAVKKTFSSYGNPLVFLCDTATTVPNGWKDYHIFVLPINNIEVNGNASLDSYGKLTLPTITTTPTYCALTDKIFRVSNDNFKTYTDYNPDDNLPQSCIGYQLRVGIKNQSMTDYVFSTNNVHIIQEPKVVVKYNYSFGNLWSWSKESPLYFSQHGTTSDTVKLIGAWSIADLELMKAGFSNYTTSDNTLIKFDMSEAYFIDNEIDVFNNFFGRFTNLETVIWPSVQVNNKIDLKKAFYECNNLMHIENLKNLNNITNLGYAFYQCYKLESIAFSDSINNNPIDFGNTFEECNNLRKVINFENFVDVKNWSYTFSFCNKIDTIHISSDPNKAIYTYGTFDNCYKTIKMMPIGVTELPDNWKIYSNFVMPFDSIVIAENVGIGVNGGIIDSPQLIIYPTNVIATDYVFQLSNDGFETYTTHNIADSLTGNYIGYSLRLGGKNARMNDYVYSNNIVKLEPRTIYTAYFGNSVVEYTNKDIRPSLFENADSVTITGKLTQTQIDNLNNYTFTYYRENDNGSIEYQYNNQTQKLNLSKAYFDNVTKWKSLYLGSLSVLVLPDTIYDQPIDFDIHGTLLNPSIKRIENMEKLTNLVSLKYIFSNCWQLEEIHLGVDPNKYDSLSLVNAFTDCNAIKYMPDSVVSIPTVWHKFNNFVLPIDNVTLSGPIEFFADRCITLPSADSITYSPSYVCASDFLWQISNDGFNNNIITCNTDSFSKIDTNLLVDYKLRVGFKNKHTTEFTFSNAVNLTPVANLVIAYNGNSAKMYKSSNLPAYQIKDQTDSIIMYGTWTNADIQHLGNSMSSQRDNWHYNGIGDNRLMKVDMSQITFSDTLINMNGLFGYCWNLRELILPEKEVSINVSAYQLLTGDGKLHTLKNFENLTNITDFGLTFSNCSSLKEVHLGSDPNKLSSPELMYTFYDAESIIKYLPQGVTTIPKAWQEVIGIHKPQNFVIPIESVKSYISVNNDFLPYSGDVEYKSSATNLKLNSIFPTPSYAYVLDTIYVISYNDFATSDTISSLDGLLSSVEQPNFKLRIGLRNPISDFVYSEHSFIKNTDAVTETSASNVWVRPNPAKDYITIGTNSSNSIVSIYNILGKLVLKQNVGQNETINISHLAQGTYIVLVDGIATKLTKE